MADQYQTMPEPDTPATKTLFFYFTLFAVLVVVGLMFLVKCTADNRTKHHKNATGTSSDGPPAQQPLSAGQICTTVKQSDLESLLGQPGVVGTAKSPRFGVDGCVWRSSNGAKALVAARYADAATRPRVATGLEVERQFAVPGSYPIRVSGHRDVGQASVVVVVLTGRGDSGKLVDSILTTLAGSPQH